MSDPMSAADPLDLARELVRAFNAGDASRAAALYAADCRVEGLLPLAGGPAPLEGRAAVEAALADFFARYEGALEGGACLRLRTLARLEAPRGWVHLGWMAACRERGGGPAREAAGYTQLLVERGAIVRQQSAIEEGAVAPEPELPSPHAWPRSYPLRPIVGVGAVVVLDGRVVLVKRKYEPLAGQWSLPGGTLEVGETLEAGVAREVLEETGLAVEVGPVIEVFDRILLDGERRVRYHFVLIDYLCRVIGGRLRAGSDVADVALASPEEVETYGLTPKAVAIVRKGVRLAQAAPEGRLEPL
ncbi:MAG TPA: NUDIX hydrolase [Candidatus Tectomicrobia bacterium]|nr:NUDIX hydrolase [Candidatus Tectomicrobia bacterium]